MRDPALARTTAAAAAAAAWANASTCAFALREKNPHNITATCETRTFFSHLCHIDSTQRRYDPKRASVFFSLYPWIDIKRDHLRRASLNRWKLVPLLTLFQPLSPFPIALRWIELSITHVSEHKDGSELQRRQSERRCVKILSAHRLFGEKQNVICLDLRFFCVPLCECLRV